MSGITSPTTTIDQHTIVSKTGEGSMGEVYRARDTNRGRAAADGVGLAVQARLGQDIGPMNQLIDELMNQ